MGRIWTTQGKNRSKKQIASATLVRREAGDAYERNGCAVKREFARLTRSEAASSVSSVRWPAESAEGLPGG
jgi:hypothetical protein